jgi:hypothetical protein
MLDIFLLSVASSLFLAFPERERERTSATRKDSEPEPRRVSTGTRVS